ncbi:MAG: hypothetical protein M3301_05530, partial [Chloroflexota bacterium]|nr:hypothetical protein [Chloroflexota bacterium]
SPDLQPTLPLRAAFYYPWFPEAWDQNGIRPYTWYTPALGWNDSADPATIRAHLAAMEYGNIRAGIASWWGQGSRTDARLAALLSATAGSAFRWAVYHEAEGYTDPSVTALAADLVYLRDRYGSDPSYLRIAGKFVVFVYADAQDGCSMVDRWKQANTVGAYLVLKVFPGYGSCASQPDGWHQYAPALAVDSQPSYSFSISPGFWSRSESSPRLGRDLARWYQNVRDMVASGAPLQLVNTFNEWGEGTSVENAQEWSSASGYGAYLDALHTDGAGGPSSVPADTTPPTGTITINDGARRTKSVNVTLRLAASDASPGSGVASMRFRNDGETWTAWEPFATTRPWTLRSSDGTRTVFAEFQDRAGNVSATVQDSILLDRVAASTTTSLTSYPALATRVPSRSSTGVYLGGAVLGQRWRAS